MYIQHPENKHTSIYIYILLLLQTVILSIYSFSNISIHMIFEQTPDTKVAKPVHLQVLPSVCAHRILCVYIYIYAYGKRGVEHFSNISTLCFSIYIYISTYTRLWGKITLVWCIIHTHVYIYIYIYVNVFIIHIYLYIYIYIYI